jgi:hypothetical protein
MKPALKITAHLAVGLAAFFLIAGTGIWEKRNPADGVSLRTSEKERSGGSGKSAASRNTAVKTRMKAAEYRAAWDAIAGMKWSKSERLAYQTKLLAEWAETDLDGALAAALSESWKDGLMSNFGSPFHDVFVDRAEDIRRLIDQRKLGVLETSLLLRAWSSTLASRSPDLYLAYLRGLDGADFSTAVSAAVDSVKDKELGFKIMEVMAAKAQDEWAMEGLARALSENYGEVFSKEELMERLAESGGGMSAIYTALLAGRFLAFPDADTPDKVTAEIDSLPEDKRGLFAKALLNSQNDHPGIIHAALDHLLSHEQWQLLDKQETSRAVQIMRENADPVEMAEWAAALPPREETTEMFHRGVEPYIRKDREAAWNWIQQMDAGYWRDRALAEYSQVNLHVFNDPEKSSAAIGQITDPAFRDTVKGWRSGWEKQKGR